MSQWPEETQEDRDRWVAKNVAKRDADASELNSIVSQLLVSDAQKERILYLVSELVRNHIAIVLK